VNINKNNVVRYPRIARDANGVPTAVKTAGNSRNFKVIERLPSFSERGYVNKMELFARASGANASEVSIDMRRGLGRDGGHILGRSNAFEVWSTEFLPRSRSRFDHSTLRAIYQQAAAVRTAVDAIIREITTMPWAIVPKERDPRKVKNITWARCITTLDFIENPNQNPETFQQLLSKFLTDLLVLDAGAIELVRAVLGRKLVELFTRDGSTFMPKVDQYGVLLGYQQYISRSGKDLRINFEPDELMYVTMYPQTYSVYGLPILDSIINEVAALLYAVDFIANSFQDQEIPPGILHLGNIGDDAYQRAKNEFKVQRGYKKVETKMRVIDNVDIVEWIDFKRPNREQQTSQLIHMIEKIVYRSYGVQPTEVGLVEGITKATAEVSERLAQIKLTQPIMTIISTHINKIIIPSLGYHDVKFRYIVRRNKDDRDEALAERDRVNSGLRTVNEVREADGWLPVDGGDRPFVLVGKRIYFLDELEHAVSEAWVQDQERDEAIRGGHEDEGIIEEKD